jgi:hypothetical protein
LAFRVTSDPFGVPPSPPREIDIGVILSFDSLEQLGFGTAQEALNAYVFQTLRRANVESPRGQATKLYDDLLTELRVPEFGSPPRGWKTLGEIVGVGAPTGVLYAQDGDPVLVLVTGVALTFAVRIVLPWADALGRGAAAVTDGVTEGLASSLQEGVEHHVRRLMNLPMPTGSEDDAASGETDPGEERSDLESEPPSAPGGE